jgi:hypothetical protein
LESNTLELQLRRSHVSQEGKTLLEDDCRYAVCYANQYCLMHRDILNLNLIAAQNDEIMLIQLPDVLPGIPFEKALHSKDNASNSDQVKNQNCFCYKY